MTCPASGCLKSSVYEHVPDGVKVITLETDQECAQAIASGRNDFVGYVTSGTVVDANIAAGMPVEKLGTPVYAENLAAAYDKGSTLPSDTFRAEVDKIITQMHTDGTLTALSNQWFGSDLTQAPAVDIYRLQGKRLLPLPLTIACLLAGKGICP